MRWRRLEGNVASCCRLEFAGHGNSAIIRMDVRHRHGERSSGIYSSESIKELILDVTETLMAACYTPLLSNKTMCLRRSIQAALLLCVMLIAVHAPAQSGSPLRELAQKILQHAQTRSAITLSAKNLANVSAADFSSAQRELETQLRSLGVRFVKPDQAVETVRVTLSDTPHGLLWIAEIEHAGSREVAIVSGGQIETPTRRPAPSGVAVRRILLFKQAARMLDVAPVQIGNNRGLLILEAERIVLRSTPESAIQEVAIPHSRPWPRDLRGRLQVTANGSFEAQLPGVKCGGTTQSLATSVCQETDDPWALGSLRAFYNASRNYFTGMLAPSLGSEKLSPFFTVAELSQPSSKFSAFNGIDGRTRIFSAAGDNVATVAGWGSDITGIAAECGSGGYILATRVGESDHPDSIQAFELVNREPVEASAPIEVPGPVIALWATSENASAIAVVQNTKTLDYEAYILSVTCGR